jgi:glycosyltransferase involved in cell wall biosynthesis
MSRRKVSVIIPNYNYARFLGQAIESVLSQSFGNLELIVVNNGSSDNSLEVLQKYKREIIIVNQSNLGQSGARNSGLSQARGDLISFLDADDYWEIDKLERQISLLNSDTQLVYCGITPFDNANLTKGSPIMPSYKGDCSEDFYRQPGASIVLSGESTAIFTRELLNKVGLFDSNLNSTAGWDFFRRCSRFTKFDFVSESLVNYRLHSTNMSNSKISVIRDMRLAYIKFFNDSDWKIPNKAKHKTNRALEWSYFKTFLKCRNFRLAVISGFNLVKEYSKSF